MPAVWIVERQIGDDEWMPLMGWPAMLRCEDAEAHMRTLRPFVRDGKKVRYRVREYVRRQED